VALKRLLDAARRVLSRIGECSREASGEWETELVAELATEFAADEVLGPSGRNEDEGGAPGALRGGTGVAWGCGGCCGFVTAPLGTADDLSIVGAAEVVGGGGPVLAEHACQQRWQGVGLTAEGSVTGQGGVGQDHRGWLVIGRSVQPVCCKDGRRRRNVDERVMLPNDSSNSVCRGGAGK
jgi:hypothetical protein